MALPDVLERVARVSRVPQAVRVLVFVERAPVLDAGSSASARWTSSHAVGEARVRFHATGDEARRLFQCAASVGNPGRAPGLVGFGCRGAIEGVPGRPGEAQVSDWHLIRGTFAWGGGFETPEEERQRRDVDVHWTIDESVNLEGAGSLHEALAALVAKYGLRAATLVSPRTGIVGRVGDARDAGAALRPLVDGDLAQIEALVGTLPAALLPLSVEEGAWLAVLDAPAPGLHGVFVRMRPTEAPRSGAWGERPVEVVDALRGITTRLCGELRAALRRLA